MPPPVEELRARPDFYLLKFRRKVHRQTLKLGREVKKIVASYNPQIKRVAEGQGRNRGKQYVAIGNMMMDEVSRLTHKRVSETEEYAIAEATHIFDLMMPKGTGPTGKAPARDFWRVEFKGMTPNEREARLRIKIARKMRVIPLMPMKESVLEEAEYATRAWSTARSYVEAQATGNLWLSGIMGLVDGFNYQNAEQDVISHYEHLATLDELTCEECASLDGAIIETGASDYIPGVGGGAEASAWGQVNIHPRCRCVPVPVTKSWRELGFDIDEPPMGTRIARPGYPQTGPRGGRTWGKSSPGADSVQGYVPADTRYKNWQLQRGFNNPLPADLAKMNADDFSEWMVNHYLNGVSGIDSEVLEDFVADMISYQGSSNALNAYLRGVGKGEAWFDDVASNLQNFIAGQKTPYDLTTYRGVVFNNEAAFKQFIKGKTNLLDDGFMNVTTDKSIAQFHSSWDSAGSFSIIYETNIPAGTQAVWSDAFSLYPQLESELVVQRGSNLIINSIEQISSHQVVVKSTLVGTY